MSSRAQNDVILYALLGRKITPAPLKKTVSTRRERNREDAKVSGGHNSWLPDDYSHIFR